MFPERFTSELQNLPATDIAAIGSWVVVVGFIAFELVALNGRDAAGTPQRVREARQGAVMGAGALGVGVVYGLVFSTLWAMVATHAPDQAVLLWERHPVLGFVAAFIAWDLSGFCYHWLGHNTSWGWAAHQAHHSGDHYGASLALRLSWTPWHGLLHHPLLALAGFDLTTILIAMAVSNVIQALQHTDFPVSAPRWVERVITTPDVHRTHHLEASGGMNLAPILRIWDVMFGTTADPTPHGTPLRSPADSPSTPKGAVEVQLAGWIELFQRPFRSPVGDRNHPEAEFTYGRGG